MKRDSGREGKGGLLGSLRAGAKVGEAAAQLAGQAVSRARHDPRVQDVTGQWRQQARQWRGQVQERADERLEELIEQRRQDRGETGTPEVDAALAQRRRERVRQAEKRRWESAALAQAQTPEERRVLTRVLEGPNPPLRYTALLDTLAPGGDAAREMAVHRAIWSLAERRVLAVSPHGEVTVALKLPDLSQEGTGTTL